MDIEQAAKAAREASRRVATLSAAAKNRVLRDVARGFRGEGDAMPARLLARIDTALRIMVAQPERWAKLSGEILGDDPAEGLAALVAMRRNLFPQAPDFQRGLVA